MNNGYRAAMDMVCAPEALKGRLRGMAHAAGGSPAQDRPYLPVDEPALKNTRRRLPVTVSVIAALAAVVVCSVFLFPLFSGLSPPFSRESDPSGLPTGESSASGVRPTSDLLARLGTIQLADAASLAVSYTSPDGSYRAQSDDKEVIGRWLTLLKAIEATVVPFEARSGLGYAIHMTTKSGTTLFLGSYSGPYIDTADGGKTMLKIDNYAELSGDFEALLARMDFSAESVPANPQDIRAKDIDALDMVCWRSPPAVGKKTISNRDTIEAVVLFFLKNTKYKTDEMPAPGTTMTVSCPSTGFSFTVCGGYIIYNGGWYYGDEAATGLEVTYDLAPEPEYPYYGDDVVERMGWFDMPQELEKYRRGGEPGIRTSGFVNTTRQSYPEGLSYLATYVEWAKAELSEGFTYDTVHVCHCLYGDRPTGLKVTFFTKNIPGGDISVYMNEIGVTLLIVAGE